MTETPRLKRFWHWYLRGYDGKPGITRAFDCWLMLHVAVGITLYTFVPLPLKDAANTILLPLAGILIGLAFAWSGNTQAVLASGEVQPIIDKNREGLALYLFTYQAAILYLLITLSAWAIAGLDVFSHIKPTSVRSGILWIIGPTLYAIGSFSIRECWHVVLSAQYFVLMSSIVREVESQKMDEKSKGEESRTPHESK